MFKNILRGWAETGDFVTIETSTQTNQGSVAVGLQAQLRQGSGLSRGLVVQGTCFCLDSWGNLHEGQCQGDQPYPPQTSGLTECL